MTTITKLADKYYLQHEFLNRSPQTVKWHQTSHRIFFQDCNIKTVEDITRDTVYDFIMSCRKRNLSPTTIRTYVRSIKAFYNEKHMFQKGDYGIFKFSFRVFISGQTDFQKKRARTKKPIEKHMFQNISSNIRCQL